MKYKYENLVVIPINTLLELQEKLILEERDCLIEDIPFLGYTLLFEINKLLKSFKPLVPIIEKAFDAGDDLGYYENNEYASYKDKCLNKIQFLNQEIEL